MKQIEILDLKIYSWNRKKNTLNEFNSRMEEREKESENWKKEQYELHKLNREKIAEEAGNKHVLRDPVNYYKNWKLMSPESWKKRSKWVEMKSTWRNNNENCSQIYKTKENKT